MRFPAFFRGGQLGSRHRGLLWLLSDWRWLKLLALVPFFGGQVD